MKKKVLLGLERTATFLSLLIFLSIAVVITLNFRSLYYGSVKAFNITENTGLSETIIRRNYDVLIDYNQLFGTKELKFPDFSMSENGRTHFEEVKQIFIGIEILGIISFILLILIAVYLLKNHQLNFLKYNCYFGMGIPIFMGILIRINWKKSFVLFHKLFFDNDYWIFDINTDPIITILPDEFFFVCAIMILFLFLVFSCVSGIIYRKLKHMKEIKRN